MERGTDPATQAQYLTDSILGRRGTPLRPRDYRRSQAGKQSWKAVGRNLRGASVRASRASCVLLQPLSPQSAPSGPRHSPRTEQGQSRPSCDRNDHTRSGSGPRAGRRRATGSGILIAAQRGRQRRSQILASRHGLSAPGHPRRCYLAQGRGWVVD
jgi:hypothetical protein